MARSYRHTPICGLTTCRSEKSDKKEWHSRFRAMERDKLIACTDWDDYITSHFRDASDAWLMGKDGRQRLNFVKYPELKRYMRK